jgi:hypothetical protein
MRNTDQFNYEFIIKGRRVAAYVAALLVLLLFTPKMHAQFGVNAAYMNMGPNDWEEHLGEDFHRKGFTVGLDYWMRLKDYRVEFTPGIWYNKRESVEAFTPQFQEFEFNSNYLSLQLTTSFYPLDFDGDCNCPTFSKGGDFIKKGFFVQLAPEIGLFNHEVIISSAGKRTESGNTIFFGIGAGAGIDIGLTDLFTITPIVKVTYYPSVTWEGMAAMLPGTPESTAFLARQIGVRLGFRPDYLKQQGRF